MDRLDTHHEIVTPEGVSLHLPVAGPVPRALAWTIDLLIRGVIILTGSIALGVLGGAGQGAMLVLLFALTWFYQVVFEAVFDGRTPGKRALGLQVVSADGAPIGWRASFVRNLLRTVDMLPFGYATGLVACLCDPAARRLGDMVAGTLVVHRRGSGEQAVLPSVPARAAPVPLAPEEQAAIVAFAERAPALTPARRDELADIASPMLDTQGAQPAYQLYAIANGLLGRA